MILKKRPKFCKIQYNDTLGKVMTEELQEKRSRVFQHELDHLEGRNLYDNNLGIKHLKELEDDEDFEIFIKLEKAKGYLF
jgi:peptide deformylase